MQSWHDVAILHGTVTVSDVYRTLQEKIYDSVYFASHGGPEGILLSNNVVMSAEDIAQAARQREVRGLFFAACNTGRLASYCVRHGIVWAISSEVELPDETAWKLAAAFYGHQTQRARQGFRRRLRPGRQRRRRVCAAHLANVDSGFAAHSGHIIGGSTQRSAHHAGRACAVGRIVYRSQCRALNAPG